MKYLPAAVALLVLSVSVACAQDPKFPQISDEIYQKANTATNLDYLDEEEKRVIYLVNLARTEGALFAETYLQAYVKSQGISPQEPYLKSLYQDLKDAKMPPLAPHPKLSQAAAFHAEDTGEKGLVSHDSSDGTPFGKRVKRFVQAGALAENCSYGYATAEGIVMQLLLDANTPSLGHRKNILNPVFDHIGVAIHPHQEWKFTCVQDFAAKIREPKTEE